MSITTEDWSLAPAAPPQAYDAVVLAGGEGRRMDGRDKGLVDWQGRPLYHHALDRLARQTLPPHQIFISANRHLDTYAQSGHAIVGDAREGFRGPLAGMEAALRATTADRLLCIPCDMPCLPSDLAERLAAALDGAPAAYAITADGPQPVCCMLSNELADALTAFLDRGRGRVLGWLAEAGAVAVPFDDAQAFANFNSLAAMAAHSPEQA